MEQVASHSARLPVLTSSCCPAASSYSTAVPSTSKNAMPLPERRCMMKPSPPKKPAAARFWKKVESSTPEVEARNARFCAMTGRSGVISTARTAPTNDAPKAIIPPFCGAV